MIKSSPSQLLLGFEQRNHSDFHLAQYTKALTGIDVDLEQERKRCRDNATQATDLIKRYNKEYRDQRLRTPTVYKENDFVLIRNTRNKPGENSKLKTEYKGLYIVAKVLGHNRYVIQDIPFNQAPKPLDTILSSDRLKPFVK